MFELRTELMAILVQALLIIFAISCLGICSALQHDTIMEGGPADFAIVEKEAEKIAEEAINELKKSQESCFPAHTGIPNWTGKHGCRGM